MRILLVILSLALYGAYSLIERLTDVSAAERAPTTATAFGPLAVAEDLAGATFNTVTSMAGLETGSLPESGCSESLLSAENLEQLISVLPEPQQVAMAQVLNMSSSVWTAQLYTGTYGYGLCLPVHQRVILLPAQAQQMVENLQTMLPQR